MSTGRPVLDNMDREIIRIRRKSLNSNGFPRIGDWVEFPDGTTKRITAVFAEGYPPQQQRIQTGQGEFYLGFGFVASMNCHGYEEIPLSEISLEPRMNYADVYIYHHDEQSDENKVGALIPVRVWWCNQ